MKFIYTVLILLTHHKLLIPTLIGAFCAANILYSYDITVKNKSDSHIEITVSLVSCLNSDLSPRPEVKFSVDPGKSQTENVGACCVYRGFAVSIPGWMDTLRSFGDDINTCANHTIIWKKANPNNYEITY
jgi:hypothetical protein